MYAFLHYFRLQQKLKNQMQVLLNASVMSEHTFTEVIHQKKEKYPQSF